MRDTFIEYLAAHSSLADQICQPLRSLIRGAPEPIGSIAFKYGMLTSADIDNILDQQRKNHRPFGQIAIEMRIFTEQQLEALLKLQDMRAATEIAEAAALSGLAPVEEIISLLGQFLRHISSAEVVR